MNPIFNYLDYRDFLKDLYEEKKRQHSWFSYRVFSSKVGIDASYLAKVILKTRHIAENSVLKLTDYCGFTAQEREYFENLVRFAKARTEAESKLYFEKLLACKSVDSVTLTADQYEYYTRWYYTAIRSVLEYYPFYGRKFRELGEQLSPAVSASQTKQAVQLLERLGLIRKNDTGKYEITSKAVSTGEQWQGVAVRSFQQETLTLSRESLDRHAAQDRDISTVTMNIDAALLTEIKEMAREFRTSVIKLVNDHSGPDRTYQLNIQLIPLSRPCGEDGNAQKT